MHWATASSLKLVTVVIEVLANPSILLRAESAAGRFTSSCPLSSIFSPDTCVRRRDKMNRCIGPSCCRASIDYRRIFEAVEGFLHGDNVTIGKKRFGFFTPAINSLANDPGSPGSRRPLTPCLGIKLCRNAFCDEAS